MSKQDELRARKGLMSVREVAEALGAHQQTVYSWVANGKLPHFRVGGRVKFDGKAIAEWLDQRAG